jgi:hypothetical protein
MSDDQLNRTSPLRFDARVTGNGSQRQARYEGGDLSRHQMAVRRNADHVRASRVELIKVVQIFYISELSGASSMKGLFISTLVSAAIFAAAMAIQRSPSTELSAGIATMVVVASNPHSDRRK